MEEEDFIARRDRLLLHYGMSLEEFTRYTELLTSFSPSQPLMVRNETLDRLVATGLFDIDPRLKPYVKGYSNIPLSPKEFKHYLVELSEPAETVRELRPKKSGPWPPQHPRSARRQR